MPLTKQDCQLFPAKPVTFCCGCTLERAGQNIITMGRDEAMAILADHQFVEVVCDFCNTAYQFSREEVEALFAKSS
ncbi:MAG: hypothetical protein GY821_03955 [Gammaproteobacteria bacterium]|nr:hypothetical protein [Gammaproteobacteria bacterium]